MDPKIVGTELYIMIYQMRNFEVCTRITAAVIKTEY